MKKAKKPDPNFYRFPKPIEGTIIVILMLLLYLSIFDVKNSLLDYYGPLGTLGRYLNNNYYGVLQLILYSTIAVHVGEAVYAGILCKRKAISPLFTIIWVVQTFIIGFPSLLQLVGHKQSKKKT